MKAIDVGKKNRWLAVLMVLWILLLILIWKIYESGKPVKLKTVLDSETVVLTNGKTVKLGKSTTGSGSENEQMKKQYLETLLDSRNIWVEHKKNVVWLWVGCEDSPKFWIFRKAGENPVGCKKGVLANDQMMKLGWVNE